MEKSILLFIIFFYVNNLFCQETDILINTQKSKFVSEGFGFIYSQEEITDIALFIQNHGQPIMMTDHVRVGGTDIKIIILYYDTIIVNFSKDGKNEKIRSVSSRDDISYLYGIKHGMDVAELFSIIGKRRIYNDYIYPHIELYDENGNSLSILLKNNKILRMYWAYDAPLPEEYLNN